MRKLNSSSLLGLGLLCSVVMSCVPDSEISTSETRSLDNFAAGTTVTVNSCSGDEDLDPRWDDGNRIIFGAQIIDKLTTSTKEKYIARVKNYLSSVPLAMQKAYLDFGGVIVMNDNAWQRCSAPLSEGKSDQLTTESRRLIESCMLYLTDEAGGKSESLTKGTFAEDSKQSESLLAIYHQVDPADVGVKAVAPDTATNKIADDIDLNEMRLMHGGTRVFGLMFGQFFSRISVSTDQRDLKNGIKFVFDPAEQTKISTGKLKLANQYLIDVATSDEFDLESVEIFLGRGAAAKIRSYLFVDGVKGQLKSEFIDDGSRANPLGALGLDGLTQARFEDYVYGETFDSDKCSAESNAILADKFPRSKTAFEALDDIVIKQAALISMVVDADSDDAVKAAKSAQSEVKDTGSLSLQYYGSNYYQASTPCIGCSCASCRNGDCASCPNCPGCQGFRQANAGYGAGSQNFCAACNGMGCAQCAAARQAQLQRTQQFANAFGSSMVNAAGIGGAQQFGGAPVYGAGPQDPFSYLLAAFRA